MALFLWPLIFGEEAWVLSRESYHLAGHKEDQWLMRIPGWETCLLLVLLTGWSLTKSTRSFSVNSEREVDRMRTQWDVKVVGAGEEGGGREMPTRQGKVDMCGLGLMSRLDECRQSSYRGSQPRRPPHPPLLVAPCTLYGACWDAFLITLPACVSWCDWSESYKLGEGYFVFKF